MKQFKSILRGVLVPLTILAMTLLASFAVSDVSAAQCDMNNMSVQSGASCAQGNGQPTNLFIGSGSVFKRITDIMLFIVGAIAVIMLIIGGIRYVVSGGDQTQVTAAKNTVLYAIIGIVVAVLAYAAVNFVTGALNTVTGNSPDAAPETTQTTTP